MKRLLIYGFRPYGEYDENISEKVVHKLPVPDRAHKVVFDVRFDKTMFYHTLSEVQPEIILGLGQHPRARKLRLERKTINLQAEPGQSPGIIDRNGPAEYFASLSLPESNITTVTYHAGTYVCNYSMYLMGRYCEDTGERFGFIHIPKDFPMTVATEYLQSVIKMIQEDLK